MSHRTLVSLVAMLFFFTGVARAEIQPDFLMDLDPEFRPADPVKDFSPDFKGLWITALERPEIDLQRMAAETISLAHKVGVPHLIDAVPALEKILMAESSPPTARFAAARALTVLESRSSSDKLFEASQKYGADLRQLVEPALAHWDFVPIRALWIQRLEAPATRPRDLILAIRGLGHVRETSALSTLLKIALDLLRVPDIRLEAASAAGLLAETGLEAEADRLFHETRTPPIINRLCALRLLARHGSETGRQLLIELATDAEPTIAAAALERLNEIDPALVLPLVERAITNADQHVREQAASAYVSLPSTARIRPLAELLDDPHPTVRKRIREDLYRLAQNPEFNDTIRAAAMEVLARERWQGQEQATLLLGALEHQPAAKRMVELLESPRLEVMIGSAWSLRKVADPQTIPAILDQARRQTIARRAENSTGLDHQVAHLFEACGRMRAADAASLMLEYVPKDLLMGERSRSAAIWSLGWLHAGIPDESLGRALIDRATDSTLYPPESDLVKQLSVVSLARMRAVDHGPALRRLLRGGTPNTHLGLALRWAIKELTGEELPPPGSGTIGTRNWFLEPLGFQTSNSP